MTLYQIIKQLQDTPGTNDKLAILEANKDNELLKLYVEATLSPRINFYITKKTIPAPDSNILSEVVKVDKWLIDQMVSNVANRKLTGQAAKDYIAHFLFCMDSEDKLLLEWMLLKDFRAKVGETLVAKVWPEFSDWSVKYMRCSLPKDVKLNTWPWQDGVISQVKADGMYVEVGPEGIFTRNGSKLDVNCLPFASQEGFKKLQGTGKTYTGELTVDEKIPGIGIVTCDRKTGNGVLNSALSGNPVPDNYSVIFTTWDYVCSDDTVYKARLSQVLDVLGNEIPCVQVTQSRVVYSYEEAVAHFMECTAEGLEGTVIKNPRGKWKNGTSKDQVKLKIEAEVDLRIVGMAEGNGKNAGQCGALQLTSEDGKVLVDCGTGFSDAIRQEIFDNFDDQWLGKIVTVKANDLLDKRGSDTLSLFLPVFIELRKDKDVADTAERIKSIFDSAKGLT